MARRPSTRTQRRKNARQTASTCGLCFDTMSKADRAPYNLDGGTSGLNEVLGGRRAYAHKLCIARHAEQRAQQAENTVAQMKAGATRVQEQLATAQRAQTMGLWLPGQG